MTILIVEDAIKFARNLKRALEIERYTVNIAYDGEEGLRKALKNEYDVIILDLMLPKVDGIEVSRELRKRNIQTPIIMLTARGSIEDRVTGLDSGADDYLVKPFGFPELFARIRSVLRRKKTTEALTLRVADLELDPAIHAAKRGGEKIILTPKEYALLDYLLRYRNKVLTRTQLMEHIWGPDKEISGNKLNVHIRYLRKKIDEGRKKKLIQTIKGVGYKIAEE